jgi:hypothetical protein
VAVLHFVRAPAVGVRCAVLFGGVPVVVGWIPRLASKFSGSTRAKAASEVAEVHVKGMNFSAKGKRKWLHDSDGVRLKSNLCFHQPGFRRCRIFNVDGICAYYSELGNVSLHANCRTLMLNYEFLQVPAMTVAGKHTRSSYWIASYHRPTEGRSQIPSCSKFISTKCKAMKREAVPVRKGGTPRQRKLSKFVAMLQQCQSIL